MGMIGMGAGDKGVERFDAMDQSLALQEIERTIDRRRHDPRALILHRLEQAIGSDRLTCLDYKFEDFTPRVGQSSFLIGRRRCHLTWHDRRSITHRVTLSIS